MTTDGTVSDWIHSLQEENDQTAAQRIFERYIDQLVRRARALVRDVPRGVADEEDIAAQAIEGLFAGIEKGQFPKLNDRDDLWQILMRLVRRRAIDHVRRYRPEAGVVVGESVLGVDSGGSQPRGMDRVADDGPAPEDVAAWPELLRDRLRRLHNDRDRQIALWKLEGRTNREIAAMLKCTTRTVEYSLQAIRKAWEGG